MDLPELWKKAIQRYEAESNLKFPSDLPVWSASDFSADSILKELEKRQGDFKQYRENREGLRNALKPLCAVIKSTAEIIGHSFERIIPPAEAICAATILLLKTADGVGANYNAIRDMLDNIGGFLTRLDIYARSQEIGSIVMERMVVENLAHVMVIFGLAAKAIKEKRTVSYFKELLGKNSKIQEAMTKLEQLSVREGQAVGAVTLSALQKILGHLETRMKGDTNNTTTINKMLLALTREAEAISISSQQNRSLLEEIQRSMTDVPKHTVSERERAVREWLNAPDSSSNFNESHRKRTPGTGAWLTQDWRYMEWKNANIRQPMLWLTGRPGCGKSVLSARAIEDINLECKADPKVSLAYFYFDFRDPRKQDLRGLALSLIDQMSFAFCGLPSCLDHLYSQRRSSSAQPSYEELLAALRQICADRQNLTYFVIDALDECKRAEWYDLMTMLKTIQSWELQMLRILCTSRREEVLADGLSAISREINVESSIVDIDIAQYVEITLSEDPRFARWRNRKAEMDVITGTLTTRANGMFRWAFCQLESLAKCISPKDLRRALQNLPKTLYETYERILLSIDEDHHQYAHAVLQWLCFSCRPMELWEIAETIAFNFENDPPTFEEEDRLPEARDILNICSGLVTCPVPRPKSKDEDTNYSQNQSEYLELAHFSVKEYLLSELSGPVKRYAIDAQLAHAVITQSCLAYLLQLRDSIHHEVLVEYPLSNYAAKHWMDHYKDGASEDSEDLALTLLGSAFEPYYNCVRIANPDGGLRNNFDLKIEDVPKPIYYAASIGLTSLVESLVAKGANVNAFGGRFGTALQAASLDNRNESTLKALLNHGADVNALGGEYGTALQAASCNGHELIVKLLLENGADVNAKGGHFGTALQAASFYGVESTVRLLLDHGAEVNSIAGYFGTALQVASLDGIDSVAKILLDHGADVNAQGGEYGTALQAASLHSNKTTIKLLMDYGANVNAQGGEYGTALQAASEAGDISTAKILLAYGAYVNVLGGSYGTALKAAAANRHLSMVQLLLEHGADVHVWSAEYGTALEAATFTGDELIVKLLLDYGANVHQWCKFHGTAIQTALDSKYRVRAALALIARGAFVPYYDCDKSRKLRRTKSMPTLIGTGVCVINSPPKALKRVRVAVDDLMVDDIWKRRED